MRVPTIDPWSYPPILGKGCYKSVPPHHLLGGIQCPLGFHQLGLNDLLLLRDACLVVFRRNEGNQCRAVVLWQRYRLDLLFPEGGFHFVEPLDVPELELHRLLAGVAHDQQGETILGHVEGGVCSGLAFNGVGRELKMEVSEIGAAIQCVDGPKYVVMALTEEVSHVPAVGEHGVVLDVDDGGVRKFPQTSYRPV